MTWWYENEAEMKSCEHCSHGDCKNIGGTWYCLDCPECGVKEKNMWNYNELPERQEMGVSDRVVVAVSGYNTVGIGYYDYELEAWFVDGNRYPVPVYAWMAIKPPREA